MVSSLRLMPYRGVGPSQPCKASKAFQLKETRGAGSWAVNRTTGASSDAPALSLTSFCHGSFCCDSRLHSRCCAGVSLPHLLICPAADGGQRPRGGHAEVRLTVQRLASAGLFHACQLSHSKAFQLTDNSPNIPWRLPDRSSDSHVNHG